MTSDESAQFSLLEDRLLEKGLRRTYHTRKIFLYTARITQVSFNTIHIVLLYVVVLLLAVALKLRTVDPSIQLYSPVNGIVKYKTVVWPDNLGQDTPYMEKEEGGMPTDETDRRWDELYNVGLSRLPVSQAAQLPNQTAALPNDSDSFPIQLGVFHHLHCLNKIRMAFYLPRYAASHHDLIAIGSTGSHVNYSSHDAHHIGHCIDSLRRSVLCHSDTSVHTWVYDKYQQVPLPTLLVPHTCRDFGAIREWAAERAIIDEAELEWPRGAQEDFIFKGSTKD